MSRNHTRSGCQCSRRDFLARGLYGIGVGAGLPLVLSRTSAVLAAQALQGTSVERHPERILVVDRAVGRQRRPQHRGAVRGRRLLPRAAAPGHCREGRHQGRAGLRLPSVDGGIRAALQGRSTRGRPRLRLRPSQPVALLVDGVLAHRRAQRRRAPGLAGPAGRRALCAIRAQRDRQHRQRAVARRAQRPPLAARVRRSRALPPRGHRRGEEHAGAVEPAAARRRTRCSSSCRRPRTTPPKAPTSCARRRPAIARRWTTASAAAWAATCSASRRSSPRRCRRGSTTSATPATRSTPTCSRRICTAGC